LGEIQNTYTEEQKERALQLMALLGNAAEVSRQLADDKGDPVGIPETTLRHWKNTSHRDRFLEIRADVLPQIQKTIAAQLEDDVIADSAVIEKLRDEMLLKIGDMKAGEIASAYRNLGVKRAVDIDKSQLLRGNPTEIVQTQNADELIGALARIAPGMVIDSTADDISDVTVLGSGA